MSKAAQRNRPSQRHTKPHKQKTVPSTKQQDKKKVVAFAIIVILAAIPFSLGKFFEFNSPGPFDSGGYVYSAAHILNGAKIGVEEKPSAQLGTLLVNMLGVWLLGFNEIGPKLIQGILQAAALVLMFLAMRKLFGTLSAAVGVIVASVYLSAPLIAKFGNVKEQHMIAIMTIGVSCFVLYQLGGASGGKWWWAVLAGAFVSWAPLFKQTGTSAIGAMGLFVIIQALLKHKTWRQTGVDILLLLAGVTIAIGPLYVWIIGWDVHTSLPYSFVWQTIGGVIPAPGGGEQTKAISGYVEAARKLIPFTEQWPRVLRFYATLILPIALAVGAIGARIGRMIGSAVSAGKIKAKSYDRFVLLFAAWWILDMAFVWISPRSYEQYYLPLNASAAMLGGYVIALYWDKVSSAVYKGKWVVAGFVGLLSMIMMSWHIFFGIGTSPHTGTIYRNRITGNPEKRRGYAQKWGEISQRRKANQKMPWEAVGEYIRLNSEPTDKIYVWGWYPGIYVSAQRFSSASKCVMMPRPAPSRMEEMIDSLLAEFEQQPPKFIVDSRKRHVPMNRPPYELWPIMPEGFLGATKRQFLPPDKNLIEKFDKAWSGMLRERFDEAEALRYEAMKPFREFVMQNYRIVRMFGQQILFQLKKNTMEKGLQ